MNKQIRELQNRIDELNDVIQSVRSGQVDALFNLPDSIVFTTESADSPYRHVVEQMQEGAVLVNGEGLILYANKSFANLLNTRKETLIGKILQDRIRNLTCQRFSLNLEHPNHSQEIELIHPGKKSRIRIQTSIIKSDGSTNYCLIFTDITNEIKNAEIKKQKELLEKYNREKDKFISVLSHELRNPLTPIQLATQQMTGIDLSNQQELTSVLGILQRNTSHMTRLIDDLLDLAMIKQGEMNLKHTTFGVNYFVDTVIAAKKDMIAAKNIRLTTNVNAGNNSLYADELRLSQILLNVIDNAVKYTHDSGIIDLSVDIQGDHICFTVIDNGMGIRQKDLSKIFRPFRRTNRNSQVDGLGLGLTLAKHLAEKHKGKLEVTSDGIGKGTKVTIYIPLANQQDEVQSPGADDEENRCVCNKYKVLVVDDNVDTAVTLCKLIKLKGHDAQTAYDGQEALLKFDEFNPDLVCVDINMPKLDGYQVAKAIKSKMKDRSPYLIALTGYGNKKDIDKSYLSGFDEHITKPYQFKDVMQIINRHQR